MDINNVIDRTPNINVDQSYKKDSKVRYKMNDLSSVYSHYDRSLGINIITENKLEGDVSDGKNS